MTGRVFVDTNVLIYAHDLDAGLKHDRAAAIVADLWEKENGTSARRCSRNSTLT